MKTKRKLKLGAKIIIGFFALLLVVISTFFIYVSSYYPADTIAVEAISIDNGIDISNSNGALVFQPSNVSTALIFYPGGKVEYTAYAPLMIEIAQKGILCILPEMPFNLAVLDSNAAEKHISGYPEILHWYIGGHSLGGSMAASYASGKPDNVEGLILLASYAANDLTTSGLRVLSVLGSNDQVLNRESYQNNKKNLPVTFTEMILQGGNHAGFGNYGAQKGDGIADIPAKQQQMETAQAIAEFCLTVKGDK